MALSDLLSQAGNGGPNPLAFLAGLGQQQPAPPPPQTAVPQAAPIDPTGETALPAAAPGNVLARLQTGGAPKPPAVTVPHIFSGAPDVRGMSRGAAFASGLSSGLGDASKQGLLAQQVQSQNFQNNLELYKTLFQQKNTEASQAEQAKRDASLDAYYKAQTDPTIQGALATAKAKDTDVVADAEKRGEILKAIDTAHGLPEGTTAKTPEGTEFYATAKWPNKPQGADAPLNPTEERGVLASSNKIEALQASRGMLLQAKNILDTGDIYTGLEASAATAAANKLPGSMAGMAVDLDKAARTTSYDNAVKSAVLPLGKDYFGRVTNYEERVMQNLTPGSGNSPQAMRMVLDNIIRRREAALKGEYTTLDDIKSRRMFQAGYKAPDPYSDWDPDKDLAPLKATPGTTRAAGPAPSKVTAAPPSAAGIDALGSSANAAPSPLAAVPPGAIKKLQANPDKRADFDAMFGPGASDAVLGPQK